MQSVNFDRNLLTTFKVSQKPLAYFVVDTGQDIVYNLMKLELIFICHTTS